MKSALLLLLLLFCFQIPSKAQSNEQEFLHWFFRVNRKVADTIYYTNNIDTTNIKKMKGHFHRDTIYNQAWEISTDDKINGLFLKRKEKSNINYQIQKLLNFKWPDAALPRSKIITPERISDYVKLEDKSLALKKIIAWEHKLIDKYNGYYSFSKPIFIRNDTICIFDYGYGCGSTCGDGSLAVYRKVNGTWQKWILLSAWIS